MSILWLIPAAAVLAVPVTRWIERRASIEAGQGEETTGGDPDAIWQILMPVYTKLRQSRVSCRPWIHDRIAEIERGGGCDPREALAALIMTGDDLAGTRWDTDEMASTFEEAAKALAEML